MASAIQERPDALGSQAAFSPHALSASGVRAFLGVKSEQGWNDSDLQALRERYGPNELTELPPAPLWRKFLAQFQEVVILILMAAALVAGLLGEWTDAFAILAIVLLNGILGFLQEQKAERALSSLRKLSGPTAKVVRDGKVQVLPARDLVPGDHVELEAGDSVPADARLIEAFGLRIQEAALTGESVPEEKSASLVLSSDTSLGDRLNMVYLGTVVAAGRGSAIVTGTGMHTELGQIAGMLQRYEAETTPLQKKLAQLGRVLAVVCLGIVLLVFVVELFQTGDLLEVFLLSVSLAVAAVPEGLPAVVTIALALGLQRMIQRNALIRRLPSVETLGSVTVICSDKTGTLTKNEMMVREIQLREGTFEVAGSGDVERGGFRKRGPPSPCGAASPGACPEDLRQALLVGVRCNNAVLQASGKGSEGWKVVGDPTEGALLVAGIRAGLQADKSRHPVMLEVPFDSERKMMSVVIREEQDRVVLYSKGA